MHTIVLTITNAVTTEDNSIKMKLSGMLMGMFSRSKAHYVHVGCQVVYKQYLWNSLMY